MVPSLQTSTSPAAKPAENPVSEPESRKSGEGIPSAANDSRISKLSLKIRQPEEESSEDNEEDNKLSAGDKPEDKIILTDLLQVWKELAESFMDDSRSLYVAMTKHEPGLEGSTIHIDVDNAIQADEISERKLYLLNHLRKDLNNYAIRIQVHIKENNQQQKAYLPKEKLLKLIEKNPDIEQLTKELDLDILY